MRFVLSFKGVLASVCSYLNGWSQTLAKKCAALGCEAMDASWDMGSDNQIHGKTGSAIKFFKS